MRRLSGAIVVVACAAAAVTAAGGGAAPARDARMLAPTAEQAALPRLPAQVSQRRRWIIGVKCDVPPFGYIDVRGRNAGFDVEIAQWFSRYAFGRPNRVTYVCAPTPAREPLLTSDRVDLVISTFKYTADRDTRIDFSRAY
jgi:polar amino acid transport system substrate-binding protein